MKRSEINTAIQQAIAFMADMQFRLPPFAFWSPDEWRVHGTLCHDVLAESLGWDITDFGSGDFAGTGLLLFTLRNGTVDRRATPNGKTYAEKIMVVEEAQVTPTHFHVVKAEDIINRGGGVLTVKLWNATPDDRLCPSPVSVRVDSRRVDVAAGGVVHLHPGESIYLPQRLYHSFWAEPGSGRVLTGEVSAVNDDTTDNHFLQGLGRFPAIQEDVPPTHLLCSDYRRFCPAHLGGGAA